MNLRVLLSMGLAMVFAAVGMGCQNIAPVVLPDAKQAEIRAEVIRTADGFMAAMERLDITAATKNLADVPEFRHADNEGHVMDYATGKRAMGAWFAAATSQAATTKRREVVVLAADTALYIWQGAIQVNLKDGSRLQAPAYLVSALFKKMNGQWKIVFWQESGDVSPVTKAAGG
jgi:ketosteroid isomerase-like protein